MSVAAAVDPPIWQCYPNYVVCRHDHLFRLHKSDFKGDLRRLAGPAFLECQQCRPATYFLGIFSTSPSPMVTCYAISRECFAEWQARGDDETPAMQELLYLIRDPDGNSYNPRWRPPR